MADQNLFAGLGEIAPDPLLKLIPLFNADQRPDKIDLGVGVYRDDAGRTPVFEAVKSAERRLVEIQTSKAYLGAAGDAAYTERLGELVFGSTGAPPRVGLQTPGGTAALRLALELVAHADPEATVWAGAPSWPNHAPLVAAAGLPMRAVPYFDAVEQRVDFTKLMDGLAELKRGDVLLLQASCHNPTGCDLDALQWRELAGFVLSRGATPLIDSAYQGLGDGLDQDAENLRSMVQACPTSLVAVSCSKSFGLYRERVGAVFANAHDPVSLPKAAAHFAAIARGLYSMPPDHGAAVVRMILEDEALRLHWRTELDAARCRISALRASLARCETLRPLASQKGMFSTLPLSAMQVERLRRDHAIYVTEAGRINVAGLRSDQVEHAADALNSALLEG